MLTPGLVGVSTGDERSRISIGNGYAVRMKHQSFGAATATAVDGSAGRSVSSITSVSSSVIDKTKSCRRSGEINQNNRGCVLTLLLVISPPL